MVEILTVQLMNGLEVKTITPKGEFRDSFYYTNDIVLYNGAFYEAKTNLIPGAWDVTYWTLIDAFIDYIGYPPNDTNLAVTDDSTFEKTNLTNYAHPFAVAKFGDVIATVADFDNSDPKIIIYRFIRGHYGFYNDNLTRPMA